jgi:hypothetical protein
MSNKYKNLIVSQVVTTQKQNLSKLQYLMRIREIYLKKIFNKYTKKCFRNRFRCGRFNVIPSTISNITLRSIIVKIWSKRECQSLNK